MRPLARLATALGFGLLAYTPALAAEPVRLPDAIIARDDGAIANGAIAKAWLAEPTRDYAHGVLGDAIEARTLVVELRDGRRLIHRLPVGSVFEDRAGRILDADGDGETEVLVVRAYAKTGAALSVWAVRGSALVLRAETPPIGRPNRWRNPAGLADLDGDGSPEILSVTTPHIGGTLEAWALRGDRLVLRDTLEGVSNHAIGSRELDLAEVVDWDGPHLVLPDAARTSLLLVAGGPLRVVGRAALPAPVAGPVAQRGAGVTARLENGRTVRLTRSDFR